MDAAKPLSADLRHCYRLSVLVSDRLLEHVGTHARALRLTPASGAPLCATPDRLGGLAASLGMTEACLGSLWCDNPELSHTPFKSWEHTGARALAQLFQEHYRSNRVDRSELPLQHDPRPDPCLIASAK